MLYNIEIKEELSRIIPVNASTLQEAIAKVESKYNNCDIILDYSDFQSVSISTL